MKIIDDKGRFFGLINYIDLIIVLAILVAAGAFFLMDDAEGNNVIQGNNQETIRVTYLIDGVRDVSINSVNEGDVFESIKTRSPLGKVIKKEVKAATMMTTDQEGNVIYSKIPEKYQMFITMEGKGTVTDYDIKVSNEVIKIGQIMEMESKMIGFEGIVYGIDY